MRQGCAIAVAVLVMLLTTLAAVVAGLLYGAGVFENHPPQEIAGDWPEGQPAMLIRFHPQHPALQALLRGLAGEEAGAPRRFLMESLPHEVVCHLTLDTPQRVARLHTTLSLKRLSGLLAARSDTELWRWFAGQQVTELGIESPGLWRARTILPVDLGLPSTDLGEAAGRLDPIGLAPGSNAALAFVIDNRAAQATDALHPIFNPPPQPGEGERRLSRAERSHGFALVQRLRQGEGSLSLSEDGSALLEVRLIPRDAGEVSALLALLEMERDRVAARIEARGGWLEGHWTNENAELRGSFRVDAAAELWSGPDGDKP
ncbi:MAG: hypothetical protein RLZZ303_3779 [Candidatus Hydrogenedentota bacterium]